MTGLAGVLCTLALTVTACGGTAATEAPGAAGTVAPDTGATPAPDLTTAPDAGATAAPPDSVLPSFDPTAILQNLDGIDSYRISMATDGEVGYRATVVTSPVLARDIMLGTDADAQRIVIIGDETWMGEGDDLQPAPADLASGMLAAFDPLLFAAGFSQVGAWNGADDRGVEDKNGISARHFRIDPTTLGGLMAQMPPGASIDVWVAQDGGYLVSVAIVSDDGGGIAIDVTDVNDPGNSVTRPN
jgi:hypothetical protein